MSIAINDHMHELLVKYLLKETTPAENNTVQEWLQQDASHQQYFEQLQLIWNESKQLAPSSNVNENEAWDRFMQRTKTTVSVPVVPVRHTRRSWLRIAVLVILIAGVGQLVYYVGWQQYKQQVAAAGDKVTTITLADGSAVTLNKNAVLSYPKAFKGDQRAVTLTGEAFFNVTEDKKHPFIIQVNDIAVQVLGTSFNIKSTNTKTEIIVETGVVSVSKNNRSVQLKANEKIVVAKNQSLPEKADNDNQLYNYYRTKSFICNATPLEELVNILSEAYQTPVLIENDQIRHLPLTTTLRQDSLENVLAIISQTLNINVEKKDGQFILK